MFHFKCGRKNHFLAERRSQTQILHLGTMEKTTVETPTKNQTTELALEDLAMGQVFHSGFHTVDTQEIKSFAAKYDPQPFHLDEDLARSSFFGELVASGWLTVGISMRLLVESTPILGGLIGASAEMSWKKPVRPGDTLHVETEVLEIKPSRTRPERGIASLRSTTLNQNGEVVLLLTTRIVVPRRQG